MKIARRWLLNTPLNCALTMLLLLVGACSGPATPQAPAAPSNVTSQPGPGYVTVSWQDNSDNETGFEIYRESVGGLTSQQAGSKIATVDANESSFVDMDIELEQEYDYSVVAVNEVGSSGNAAATGGVSVPMGVDLMVGTINRLWSDDTNGTNFILYYVFPQAMLDDETDVFEVQVTGPPGWNDDNDLNYLCEWDQCYRRLGYTPLSFNTTTVLAGEYHLSVRAGGQLYTATAMLDDVSFRLPRPTGIEITEVSASGAKVSWTPPSEAKSHYISVHHGEYQGSIKGFATGATPTFTIEGLNLSDGIYGVEVGVWNTDVTTYPLKVDPFGWSYDFELFGLGDVYSPECASAEQAIDIPDAALQQVVRDELGILSGDLTCMDMALLTVIWAEDAGIASLEGLQYAVNLEEAMLHGNDVTDVSPLADLTKLWHLNLNVNEVTDVGPLANLTSLRELHLCCTTDNITDVTPLEGLTQIEGLNLDGHELGGAVLWPLLENFPNLRGLWVGYNELTDFSALASHPQLETLSIGGNVIADLTPIAGLTNLTELYLPWSEIDDITPLQVMTQLVRLDVGSLEITDIAFLEEFVNLDWLLLDGNQITSLAPLVANSGIGDGDYVDVMENPLDLGDPSVQADIQTLLDRGVDLHYE